MTETNATIANDTQGMSTNPWHHMKGIQRHLRIEGKILPKTRLLRPFYHEYPQRLDDKQYVVPSLSSLKESLHFFYGSLYLLAGGTVFLGWGAQGDYPQFYYAAIIALLIAIPTHIYGRSLKQDRFIIYDRERGIVRLEYGWFRLKYREIPFWESEGYLVNSPNHAGLMRPTLHLQHPSKGSYAIVEGAEYDLPLGYWSFLIQYMDKSKPLPDVPFLEAYPNKSLDWGIMRAGRRSRRKKSLLTPMTSGCTNCLSTPSGMWRTMGGICRRTRNMGIV